MRRAPRHQPSLRMGDELSEAVDGVAGDGGSSPAEEKVPPRNAAKRQRDAMLHRLKRKLPGLSPAKLEALDRMETGELERVLEEGMNPRPAAVPITLVTTEPGQKPGWPPPSQMKEWAELAHLASIAPIVGLEAGAKAVPALQHWANAFVPRVIKLGEVEHKINPQQQLAEGLAGVAAKYLGAGPGSSPEASIAVAFVCVALFGFVELAKAQQAEEQNKAQQPTEQPKANPGIA